MATQVLDRTAAGRPRSAPGPEARQVWSSNPAVVLWSTMVGKKLVMAVTGFVLVGFVIAVELRTIPKRMRAKTARSAAHSLWRTPCTRAQRGTRS